MTMWDRKTKDKKIHKEYAQKTQGGPKMFGKMFGGMDCFGGCGKSKNTSCDVLTLLVIIYVLLNCGVLNWGLDICTILILLLFFCCCFKKKSCNQCDC